MSREDRWLATTCQTHVETDKTQVVTYVVTPTDDCVNEIDVVTHASKKSLEDFPIADGWDQPTVKVWRMPERPVSGIEKFNRATSTTLEVLGCCFLGILIYAWILWVAGRLTFTAV